MTTSETYIPRPVVMYFFVAPSQKMVRWNYASIRDAKKVWHATRLQATASVPLQPWTSSVHWRYSEEAPRAVYAVEPMNKAVQVLDNPELSEQGRARIVRDIQEKIQAHRASLPKKGQGPQAAKTKPAGLGCPTQMARLRDSFKQASVPVEAVVAKPIKKVRLPPRSQKA